MLRTRFNIGFVGAVSNGKTTVVGCLSGVNTKRHSAEQKSGRTVQLGYANVLLWYCKSCGEIFSSGQKVKQKKCDFCDNDCQVEFELSLCDCPGHNSFIKTMIRGVSVIDAAIMVTDVTKPPNTKQNLEHLAILEVLGVKDLIIIQNKCDLVDEATCIKNVQILHQEFKGTIGENSPVIPICAQRGINIDNVIAHLYRLCKKLQTYSKPSSKYSGFTIIRSFDINKPDTDIDQLKGGVLGGCVIGDQEIKVGDILEIRPGLITQDKSHIPLQTKINTIFSEQQSLPSCTTGGLFALGTLMDPSLTKADRLIGSIIGPPDKLPPVVCTATIKITYINLEAQKIEKLKHDKDYYFMMGNLFIKGKCKATDKKNTFTVEFDHPICTYVQKCIIYTKENNSFVITGFATLE